MYYKVIFYQSKQTIEEQGIIFDHVGSKSMKIFLPHCVHTIHYSFWEKEIWNCLHALFQNCSRPKQLASSTCRSLPWTKYRTGAWLWSKFLIIFYTYFLSHIIYSILIIMSFGNIFFIFYILKSRSNVAVQIFKRKTV